MGKHEKYQGESDIGQFNYWFRTGLGPIIDEHCLTLMEDAQSTQVENDIKKILMMSVIKYQNLSHDFETGVWSSWTQFWPLA